MIKEAEGQAEAVLKVQKANAEGLRMIKEAGADNAVLTLKSSSSCESGRRQIYQDYYPVRAPESGRTGSFFEGSCCG